MKRSFQQQVELTLSLTKRDLKARYKDSILGFFWSFLRPAFLTLILWMVFSKILPMPFNQGDIPFWLHVLVSVLAWNFFLGAITDATQSVTSNANLLKKVHLHAEVFPLAAILSQGIHLVLALLIVLICLLFSSNGLHGELSWILLGGFSLLLCVLSVSFFASALNVYFRDIGGIIELAGMALFYISPVIYPVSIALDRLSHISGGIYKHLYMLNPVAPALTALRRGILYGDGNLELPDGELLFHLAIGGTITIILTMAGWFFFRHFSREFSDRL